MKFDVVIVGGGFAGAYCARTLGKALGESGWQRVALISERNVLIFQPMLAEVAGSALTPLDVVNPLRSFCRHVNVLQGNVQHIDWAKRQLTLDGGRFTRNHTLEFKHLVLALGSVTDLSRVPGMADYGWPMKTVADALRLRSAVINRLEEANLIEDPEARRRLLTFVIVGGGYTGVETAGQLLDLLHEAKEMYANLRPHPLRVVLVHSRAHLLEEIGERLGDYAQCVLEKRGMEMRLGVRVTEVTTQKVILSDGSFIEAHTVVSSIGNAPNPIVLNVAKQVGAATQKGRLTVERTMQVPGQTELWAVGDCADVPWDDKGSMKQSPPTAQFALRQGRQLGQNIIRAMRGQPLKPFTYRYLGQLATVGERAAVAEMFGFRFSGFIAWFVWRTVYLAKLPGLLRKLRVMTDWTFELFFRRDTSVVLPPPEDLLRSIHLEAGEVLVQQGDKCRGIFFVSRGSLTRQDNGGAPSSVPADTVIDQTWTDSAGNWDSTFVAAESADVIVFRGRAFQLLNSRLRLAVREEPAQQELAESHK
ncbi:MAG TPA: FAD-dependent oxidoreductase [Opitutaceae bacterium]|nr:FAD-dependent oxidoreductase [Opitutaceae bacterium]